MPNKNYLKGVRKERAIVNRARQNGHIAFRSAGSHSPIDVIVIDFLRMEIALIQCKPDNFSKSEKERLEQTYRFLNNKFNVSFRVI